MFTGLIETTGTLLAITPSAGATRITIASPTLTSRLNTGDSIAVNGVCLTALSIEPNAFPPRFSADLAAETIARTTLSHLRPDAVLNLELPTPAGGAALNIEVGVLGKYVERQKEPLEKFTLTEQYLIANGY